MVLLATDNIGIEQGLQVIVAMLVNLVRREDGIDIGQCLEVTAAGLIVHHSDAFLVGALMDEVKAVYAPAHLHGGGVLLIDIVFESENGKGCQSAVDGDELAQIVDNHLAVDDVQSTLRTVGQNVMERLVNGTFYLHLGLETVQHHGRYFQRYGCQSDHPRRCRVLRFPPHTGRRTEADNAYTC